jgi:hypothetical protein
MEIYLHVLFGTVCSFTLSSNPEKRAHGTHWTEVWVSLRTGLEVVQKNIQPVA